MANTKVTSRVLADNAVLTTNITDANITTAKIADNAVTGDKVADDVALAGNPTTTTQSAGNNTTRIATTAFVTTAVANIVDSAPSALDTLNELAAALGDDANFSTTITNSIATKAPLSAPTFTGDVDIDATDDLRLRFLNGGTFKGGIQVPTSSGDMISGSAVDDLAIRSQGNILFSSGGNTEHMRIASGNVGIGTTSPSSPNSVDRFLHIHDADHCSIVMSDDQNTWEIVSNNTFTIRDGTDTRLNIDPSGNIGIGTTSPATTLHLDASGGAVMRLQRTSANASNKLELSHDGTDGTITSTNNLLLGSRVGINRTPAVANSKLEVGGADSVPLINVEASGNTAGIGIGSSAMQFFHGTSEKMRIDTDGRLGVNATGTGYARITLQETSTGSSAIYALNNAASINSSTSSLIHCQFNGDASLGTGTPFIKFANQNDFIGSITGAPSNVAYNTSSDRDLKNNIVDASSQLDTIKAIQVREYDWKIDSHHDLGVIAQELYEVIPNVVTKGVESDENGRSMPWSVDYGRLTPYLIKAIQEQQEQIETLKKEVEELKGG